MSSATDYIDEDLVMLDTQADQLAYELKWAASRGGNGSGKTTAWGYWLWLKRMELYPLSNFVAVGASYKQLGEGIFSTLMHDILETKGLERNVDYFYWQGVGGAPRLKLYNGATIHSWTAEMALRVKGANVQTMILEEPQTWGPRSAEAWTAINTRLRMNARVSALYPGMEPQGRISFNPTGVGPGHWLYELLEKSWQDPDLGGPYRVWQMSSRDNTILAEVDPGYVRNLMIGMPAARWPVEIEGEYDTMGGEVYRNYDFNIHHTVPEGMPPLEYALDRPIMWGADFNVQYMRSEIVQPHMQPKTRRMVVHPDRPPTEAWDKTLPEWQDRILYYVDEISLPDERSTTKSAGAEDLIPALMARCGPIIMANGLYVYGDPSGGNRGQIISGNNPVNTVWKQIFTDLRKHGVQRNPDFMTRQGVLLPGHYIVRVVRGAVHPSDHINMVNMQLKAPPGPEPQAGYGKLISARCIELLDDYRMVSFAAGSNKVDKKTSPPSEARRTHAADASGYIDYVERSLMFERRKFEWTLDR